MSAIQRQSRLAQSKDTGLNVFEQSESPVIIPHGSFVGLGISLLEGSDPVVLTVHADAILDGAFDTEVTMLGDGTFLYPNPDGANILYNAAFVKITWDVGDIQVFQKG